MWANGIMAGSVCVAILDLLIGAMGRENQFGALRTWLYRAKEEPILQWVEKHHVMGVMTALGAAFLLAILVFIDETTGILTTDQVGYLAIIAGIACLLGLYSISYVIHARTLTKSFLRISLLFSIAMVPFLVGLSAMEFVLPGYTDFQVLEQEAWLVFFVSSLLVAGLYALFWLAIAVPLAAIHVLTAILHSAAFIAARKSGFRSGPIAAASILVACLAGLFKVFVT